MITKIYHNKLVGKVFHTLNYCLQNELKDCHSVLDLGCGPYSPLQHCKNVEYSVGVEAFGPYFEESKKNKIHSEYIFADLQKLDFEEKRFDAVIMIEVLEHLSEKEGLAMLEKAQRWAKKKIVVTSPNGFIAQKEVDNNPLQKHLSGWDYQKMRKLGFNIHGLAGLRCLRREVQNDTMDDDLMTSIRFQPRPLWFLLAALSQTVTYFMPQAAFELFSVKRMG
ncbi:MAG: class I SAM-dependent methyltransferase [Candidatus Omnitrophica bacterium]|nr:class I SAM-dependent methyltransferase [Candidatus Omnitrophota bacterium]MDD5236200.1 class I SAM-dependent methyltransferase [Candidatus Omnitrophota bacterium]MDD5610169.1 class I SAM-dependent methyltransferase [Candidatus Omnitrophota bacterium]